MLIGHCSQGGFFYNLGYRMCGCEVEDVDPETFVAVEESLREKPVVCAVKRRVD